VVSVATPDGRRTMLTDRGVVAELRPDKLNPAWFEGCGWLHLPATASPAHRCGRRRWRSRRAFPSYR
jgi:sugar/nucleoside kinase (ribokinase family)